jgi:flagellar FliJ protein
VRRFLFRLQKLLDLRKHTERQWEIKLAEATGACALVEKRIAAIKDEMNAGRAERFKDAAQATYEYLFANELYIHRLMDELEVKKEELERKKKEREAVQKEYLAHSKKRKILDKLKEKKEAEYYKEQSREDFKVADEISASSFIRKNRSGTNDF